MTFQYYCSNRNFKLFVLKNDIYIYILIGKKINIFQNNFLNYKDRRNNDLTKRAKFKLNKLIYLKESYVNIYK